MDFSLSAVTLLWSASSGNLAEVCGLFDLAVFLIFGGVESELCQLDDKYHLNAEAFERGLLEGSLLGLDVGSDRRGLEFGRYRLSVVIEFLVNELCQNCQMVAKTHQLRTSRSRHRPICCLDPLANAGRAH